MSAPSAPEPSPAEARAEQASEQRVEQRVDARGTTTITWIAPAISLFRTQGFLSDDLARFALDKNRAMLADCAKAAKKVDHASFSGFYDWEHMTGYSPTARAESTSFIVENRKQFRRVVILTGSPLVAMAVNVANLVVAGFLEATTSRPEFEARLRKAQADAQKGG